MEELKLEEQLDRMGSSRGASYWEGVGEGRPRGQRPPKASAPPPVWRNYEKAVTNDVAKQIMMNSRNSVLTDVPEESVGICVITPVGTFGGRVDELKRSDQQLFLQATPAMASGALGEQVIHVRDYYVSDMQGDAAQGWNMTVKMAAELIIEGLADIATDSEGVTWIIIGTDVARADMGRAKRTGETQVAYNALKRKLQCTGGGQIADAIADSGMLFQLEMRMRDAVKRPSTVATLSDSPSAGKVRQRVLARLQGYNETGKLGRMADRAKKMGKADCEEFMLHEVWPTIRDVVVASHMLETLRGKDFEWPGADEKTVFKYIGGNGPEEAVVSLSLGKQQAPQGSTQAEKIACAVLVAIRYSAPQSKKRAEYLGTGIETSLKAEQLFSSMGHIIQVLENAEARVRPIVDPYENVALSAAFEANVGLAPAAFLTIAGQLMRRTEALQELRKANEQAGGKGHTKAERNKREMAAVRKTLAQTRSKLRMGTYVMTAADEKAEANIMREYRRDLATTRQTEAITRALKEARKREGKGGAGREGERDKKRPKKQQKSGKLCKRCGVAGHMGRDCTARALLANGEDLTFQQLNYIEGTPTFDTTVQHDTVPGMEARRNRG